MIVKFSVLTQVLDIEFSNEYNIDQFYFWKWNISDSQCFNPKTDLRRNISIAGDIYILISVYIIFFSVHVIIVLIHNCRISKELWKFCIPASDGDFYKQNLIMKVSSNKYYELIAGRNSENIAMVENFVESGVALHVNMYRSLWERENYKGPTCCLGFWHVVGPILSIFIIYMFFFMVLVSNAITIHCLFI